VTDDVRKAAESWLADVASAKGSHPLRWTAEMHAPVVQAELRELRAELLDLRGDIRDAVTTLRWAQAHLVNGHAKRLDPLLRRLESRLGERP
jgi:hypothetical protein